MQESGQIISKAVQNNLDNKEFDWGHLKQDVREHLSHYLFEQTHRRPVILPVIMEVNQHHRRASSKDKANTGKEQAKDVKAPAKPKAKSKPKAKGSNAPKAKTAGNKAAATTKDGQATHKPRRNRKRRPHAAKPAETTDKQ